MRLTWSPAVLALAVACTPSQHPTRPSELGTARSSENLLAVLGAPGVVSVETVASCDWEVERSGLVNLEHPAARAAGLEDGPEPIQVFFHVLRHPTQGTFLVDTGVETALRDAPERAAIRGPVARVMNLERMTFHAPLGEWLRADGATVQGVFLTHLHLDHVSGVPDLPASTPLYAGPGDTRERAPLNAFVAPVIDRALAGKGALREWAFQRDPGGRFEGVLDVFGDGQVWALHVPGHTPGATAYLVRTPGGPVLLTGDASHTRWGWEHAVEPGTFSSDRPRSAKSLAALRQLAADYPALEVRLGHQR